MSVLDGPLSTLALTLGGRCPDAVQQARNRGDGKGRGPAEPCASTTSTAPFCAASNSGRLREQACAGVRARGRKNIERGGRAAGGTRPLSVPLSTANHGQLRKRVRPAGRR